MKSRFCQGHLGFRKSGSWSFLKEGSVRALGIDREYEGFHWSSFRIDFARPRFQGVKHGGVV